MSQIEFKAFNNSIKEGLIIPHYANDFESVFIPNRDKRVYEVGQMMRLRRTTKSNDYPKNPMGLICCMETSVNDSSDGIAGRKLTILTHGKIWIKNARASNQGTVGYYLKLMSEIRTTFTTDLFDPNYNLTFLIEEKIDNMLLINIK